MACQLFGPYDPANDPPSTLTDWVKSCPSAGGPFPRAVLNPNGTYTLYCCAGPSDPLSAERRESLVSINPIGLRELVKTGELSVGRGKVVIQVSRKQKPKRKRREA